MTAFKDQLLICSACAPEKGVSVCSFLFKGVSTHTSTRVCLCGVHAFPAPCLRKMKTEGYCFGTFQLTGFLEYMVTTSNHLVPDWALLFFFVNSPRNLKLTLEVTECECIETFKPFCFLNYLPQLKTDQRGCDFLIIPVGLGNSCAEPQTRAFTRGAARAWGSVCPRSTPLGGRSQKARPAGTDSCP